LIFEVGCRRCPNSSVQQSTIVIQQSSINYHSIILTRQFEYPMSNKEYPTEEGTRESTSLRTDTGQKQNSAMTPTSLEIGLLYSPKTHFIGLKSSPMKPNGQQGPQLPILLIFLLSPLPDHCSLAIVDLFHPQLPFSHLHGNLKNLSLKSKFLAINHYKDYET
jgi:hypothetical protein